MTFSIRSDRGPSGVTVLSESTSNVDGDQALASALPSGFGDCVIVNAQVQVTGIATMRANPELVGPQLFVQIGGSTGPFVDSVGGGLWIQTSTGTRLQTWIEPNHPIYFGADENLWTEFGEVDTNVAPTGDLRILLRVRRLRDMSSVRRAAYLRRIFRT